jgi:hypothetical protein
VAESFHLGRRRFLAAVGASGAVLVLECAGCGQGQSGSWRAAPRLAALLGDSAEVRAVGAHYLARARGERNPATLAALVFPELVEGTDPVGDDELVRIFRERVAGDFAEGRVARVDGWVFSLTELRLCALVYSLW